MAEFKLGRIRFVWKDQWTTATVYYQDDVVSFAGKTYICVIGHTSQDIFFSDLDIVPSKWNLMAEGQTWKGPWQPDTSYVYDDIVSYGARLYIANTIHTSNATIVDTTDGLEADQSKWDIFAEGINWTGDWQVSNRYKVNDLVKYGGTTYVCNELHVSAANTNDGLEENQSSWDYFNKGFEYKSTWTISTRYKVNDIVRYGAGAWICINDHAASSTAFTEDSANWEKFVEGFQYENKWDPLVTYQPGDIVQYGGNQYIAIDTSTTIIPTQDSNKWDIFTEGFSFIGDWNEDSSNQQYKIGEVVRLGGFTYICAQDHETAQQPPNADYWKLVNEGFRWRGEWIDDQEYFQGDVVRYSSNSYICSKYHISEGDDYSTETLVGAGGGAQGSRPDLADSGQYWSVIAIGLEESVLTTTGDLVYFSGSSPTRLPIGKEGQILRVDSDNLPVWKFLQSVEDIYYVAEHGTDRPYPESGSNIDRPFKTIRYATEQIEKGPKNPNTQFMIELNRSFIQREVTGYIRNQVENAASGSIWENFNYDTLKCERDVGFVIDRVLHDLGHGGNLKVRAAAQTFLNALADGPYSKAEENNGTGLYADLASEGAQSVAAYNYMLTLVGNVLANTAPSTVYQNATDDSTAIIDQYFNVNLEIEPGSLVRFNTLANIVITAIDSGLVSNIPAREVPQTLIKVSTGKHYESLPIVVPAYCAILGDELRSTQIFAGPATIPANDTQYSIATLDRISSLVGDIVVGSPVSATTGNTQTQFADWPLAISDQSTKVTSLVDTMKYQIDYRLNKMITANVKDPIGYSTSLLNARENIKENRDFLLAEVIAYLGTEYPTLKYGKTDTKRDAGYILDSLMYDLTYGGNSLAVITGLAYWDGDDDSKPQIPASIKTATIAAINYLKTSAQSVAGNTTIVSPYQTAVVQTLTGNVGGITEIANNVEDIVDIIEDGPAAIGVSTTLVNPTLANGVNSTTALIAAKGALDTATAGIKTDTTSWITANFSALVYNSAKCERDVGKILEAVGFDFALNSNYRTLKAAHAYLRKTALEVYTGKQKTATRQAIQYALLDATDGAIANVASDATAIARITASARIIDAVIFGATNEGSVCQTEDQNAYYAMLQLERNRSFIKAEVAAWVNYNYSNFNDYYTEATCERDIGYIIDAVVNDLVTGSNFASGVAGAAYYRGVTSASNVLNNQLLQTKASFKHAKSILRVLVDSTLLAALDTSFNSIFEILDNGLTAVPTYTFPDNGTTAAADSTTAATFIANRATYVSSVSTYLNTNYNAQWVALGAAGQAKCERDTGYIIDAITYDVLYGGNYQTVIAGDSYYSYGTLQIDAGNEKTATLAAYGNLKSTLSAAAETASQAGVEADMDDIIAIITNGAGTVTTTYPDESNESTQVQAAHLALTGAKASTVSSVTTYITDTFSSYSYSTALCSRDVDLYIDALKYDLKYPGNYKSRYVPRYYANAVTSSKEEDMFYLRDATGVRNCTLLGLNGDLTPANVYGSSRTTAGAYCSLDPGWGPDDFTTWIITRSPYVQGVTTFGNGAIGQKIDGSLHNGGNDSIVSNDFTQVISDGIGAYVTNNGRAELVSVFTYFSHMGYIAEAGGRIRATNGNNSYGTFGSVAEGVDSDEIPIAALVDNKTQYSATVSNVYTNNSSLLQVEYNHAGNDYTEAEFNVFGAGTLANLVADEYRDSGVNYVLVDQNADLDVQLGGSGYLVASNVAQSGSTTGIFLSATDGSLNSAYPGMKIYIIGGAGIGQFAIINTYNAGSKEATVTRESDGVAGWDHVNPGTPIVAPNASTTYIIEPRVTFTAPTNSNASLTLPTSTTWYDAKYFETSAQYTGLTTATAGAGTGGTFDVIRNGSKYYLTTNAAGTNYARLDTLTILGSAVGGASTANDITITVTSVNSVTGAIVDFDFVGAAQKGKFLAIGAGTNGAVSVDGVTWTAETLPSLGAGNWSNIASGLINDGSSTYKASTTVIVADGANDIAYSADADTWSSASLPGGMDVSSATRVAFGEVIADGAQRFVVISSADRDVAYSDNGGATWVLATDALASVGYDSIVYGAGKWVAVRAGTTNIAYSNNGIVWTTVTAPASVTGGSIVWGNGKFVTLGGTNGIMYSLDGVTWYDNALTLPLAVTERKLAYGQGTFVITSDDTDQVQYSHDGVYWQAYTLTTTISGGFNAIAFGNPAKEGKFVMLPNSAGTAGNVAKICTPAKGRVSVANQQVFEVKIIEPGSGYATAPTATIVDPNNIVDVDLVPQLGTGVLAQPTFVNRGINYLTSSVELDANESNGNADFPQSGSFIAVRRLTQRPITGSNVEFAGLPGEFFKLVNVISFLGTNDGAYTAFLQLSPSVAVQDILPDGNAVEMRIRFSQVRLTGHDFLDIGTGGITTTNYPGTPTIQPNQNSETIDSNGGRVFYTSTDQDGNFRVGDLFTIEQSTGVATLNAEAFNIAGLQELQLGEVTLGGNSASVTEFSTDPFFTANSDSIVPTQRAIKSYIESQIGGGGATLNVNSVTAGDIFIGTDTITSVSGETINIKGNVLFKKTVLGLPIAYNFFLR